MMYRKLARSLTIVYILCNLIMSLFTYGWMDFKSFVATLMFYLKCIEFYEFLMLFYSDYIYAVKHITDSML